MSRVQCVTQSAHRPPQETECDLSKVGEDTSGDVFWCKSCGALLVDEGEPYEYANIQVSRVPDVLHFHDRRGTVPLTKQIKDWLS